MVDGYVYWVRELSMDFGSILSAERCIFVPPRIW